MNLSEKQIHNKLNKYYKENYGEKDTDEWYVNPNNHTWKFNRNGETIILEYSAIHGKVIARKTNAT